MANLIAAVGVFIATHLVLSYRPWRNAIAARMGERAFLIAYSMLSIALVVWLGVAFAAAPYVEVWPFAPWTRWVPVLVMPLACILLVAGLTTPNPLSLTFASGAFDPDRPGILAITRHPVIWALVLWSLAHMVPNGDAAGLILFGLLTALGLTGPASIDAKRRARLGAEAWGASAAQTSNLPLAALMVGRARLRWADIGPARLAGGLALYGTLYLLHEPVIGPPPMVF